MTPRFLRHNESSMRSLVAVFVLIAIAFTEYYIVLDVLTSFVVDFAYFEKISIMGAYFLGVGVATFVGALVSNVIINRNKLLTVWIALGIVSFLLFSFSNFIINNLQNQIKMNKQHLNISIIKCFKNNRFLLE